MPGAVTNAGLPEALGEAGEADPHGLEDCELGEEVGLGE
jgi:hypothetical protein